MKRILALSLLTLAAARATAETPTPPSPNPLTAVSVSFERIAAAVSPSVVQIFVNGYGIGQGGSGVLTKQQAKASGTVLDADGLIVTNAHVVDRATRIQVLIPAGPGAAVPQGVKVNAQVVGVDTASDLALLKVPVQGLKPLDFGDSDALRQGQLVLAFGSPLGLGNTMTMGVVSALTRQLDEDDIASYIQTDAPINPGNSGGPLVDLDGRVVGINTAILTQSGGSEGLGLAIPSNTVRAITRQLRAEGRVRRPAIGIEVQSVTPTMAAALKLPEARGVIVSDIDPDGPAAGSDLDQGDVILAVQGERVGNARDFAKILFQQPSRSTVELDVQRAAGRVKVLVGVIDRPEDPTSVLDRVRPEKNLVPELDVLGVDVDEKLAAALHSLREESGVLVAAMSADAAPPATRFLPGDVIHAVNRTPVRSLAELRKAVAGLKDGDPVVVQIERQGELAYIAFEVD